MKQLIKLGMLLPLTLMMLSCEEDVPDYAGDVIDTYIVESMTYDGETFDLTSLSIENSMFVKFTREDTQFYMNSEDACDDDYQVETDDIEGVTETSILYTDGSVIDYSFEDGKLIIEDAGDTIVLAVYEDAFPPPAWTDLSHLTNDTYEPNDMFTMATPIAAGGTVQDHYLGACDDLDYFVFSAEAGTTYFMGTSTATASDLDLTLSLYTGAGEWLAFNDDYLDTWNPGLDWTCPTTGDYHFVIEELWEDQSGNYSVAVTVTTGLVKAVGQPVERQKLESQRSKLREIFFN